MAGLTITLPREPVLFSIKTVITQGGTTQPPERVCLAKERETGVLSCKYGCVKENVFVFTFFFFFTNKYDAVFSVQHYYIK